MDPNAAGPGYAGLLLWFLAIVALIPLTLWLVKRSSGPGGLTRRLTGSLHTSLGPSLGGRLGRHLGRHLGLQGQPADSPPTEVQVLSQAALGPTQRVVVVEVRHGSTVQTLVLGATGHTISHLSTLPGSVLQETA